jgi:ribosome-binding factor A
MAKAIRVQRAASIFQRELASILLYKAKDVYLKEVMITSVKVTRDLKTARVYYIVSQRVEKEKVQAALDKARGYLRTMLAQSLIVRDVPELFFSYDKGLDHAEHINDIIIGYRREHPEIEDETEDEMQVNEMQEIE